MKSFAAYCMKGHLVDVKTVPARWPQLKRFLEADSARGGKGWFPGFCSECGSKVVDACTHCHERFPKGAKYCSKCAKPLPWTESGLALARAYTESLDAFDANEKAELNESFEELTINSAATPLAATRLQQAMKKAGPVVGAALLEICKAIATGEAKRYLGLP